MAKFAVGDTVELNSGGPKMTIQAVGPLASVPNVIGGRQLKADEVYAVWFETDKVTGWKGLHSEKFNEDCLKK